METKNKFRNRVDYDQNNLTAYNKIGLELISLGIPANIKGYRYLNEAISIVINSFEGMNNITRILYPNIAMKFQTNASSVERAMRYAINAGFVRGCKEKLNKRAGYKLYESVKVPTNTEFIAIVSAVLKDAV